MTRGRRPCSVEEHITNSVLIYIRDKFIIGVLYWRQYIKTVEHIYLQ